MFSEVSKKRGEVLQGEGEVINTTAEQNCGAVLYIDSLIYFNLKHHQTRRVSESVISSQTPYAALYTLSSRHVQVADMFENRETSTPPPVSDS